MPVRGPTAVVAALIVLLIASGLHAQNVVKISKDELKTEMANPELLVLDVRADGDWDSSQWKIKGAVREDPSQVEKWMSKYPKTKPIVLYCA